MVVCGTFSKVVVDVILAPAHIDESRRFLNREEEEASVVRA